MAHGSTTTLSERGADWLEHVRRWAEQRTEPSGVLSGAWFVGRSVSLGGGESFLREDRLVASEDDSADRLPAEILSKWWTSMSPAPGASGVYEIVLPNQRCLRLWGCFEADAVRTLVFGAGGGRVDLAAGGSRLCAHRADRHASAASIVLAAIGRGVFWGKTRSAVTCSSSSIDGPDRMKILFWDRSGFGLFYKTVGARDLSSTVGSGRTFGT